MAVVGRLAVYPAPTGVPMMDSYRVKVRVEGQDWQVVDTYLAKIDMHKVRDVSMAYFDFEGKVECEITSLAEDVETVQIRPVSAGIQYGREGNTIRFFLEKPAKLSVEINGNRFNNLHLFAGAVQEESQKDGEGNAVVVGASGKELDLRAVAESAGFSDGRRVIVLAPGLHRLKDNRCALPSDTTVILAGGAVVMGGFLVRHQRNVSILGKGMVYLGHVKKETYLRGVDVQFSDNVLVQGIIIMDPAHYSVHLGSSRNLFIQDIKAFSCVGWSDGIDMMGCENVRIEDVFLRNSDDCIAIYGMRGEFTGDTRNVSVKNAILWADVAHPTMIGTHGDAEHGGSVIENISFENIDILEHHEPQDDYLGCMAVNVGDGNTVRNISYRDIRVEQFERGKLFDLQVRWNKKYNNIPGNSIKNVVFENIYYDGNGEHTSVISGFAPDKKVEGVRFRNLVVRGVPVRKPEDGNIRIGEFAEDICFES